MFSLDGDKDRASTTKGGNMTKRERILATTDLLVRMAQVSDILPSAIKQVNELRAELFMRLYDDVMEDLSTDVLGVS